MKISIVLICLGAIASANIVESYYHEQPRFLNPDAVILQVFEMLRWLIINGSPDLVPVMDPCIFDHRTLQINVPNKLLTLNANFTNGILRGLGEFEVPKVEFIKSEIAVDLAINFPMLTLTAEKYEMEGNIYQAIPLAGNGAFEFRIINFNLRSKIYLKQSEDGQSIIIDKFHNSEFRVEKVISRTEFDNNIDDIFNALVEDLLADNLTRFGKFVLAKYSVSMVDSVNPYLNQFETWRFIAAIL